MRIQHNIMAMNSYRNYSNNTSALSKNLEKLSSGYKINRAGDDAAGLAISEKMRAQIKGLEAAQKNVKDGISLVKTAEGAMQEIQDMLSRMKYLATQSANGTYDNPVDRKALQDEVDQLNSEIDRIADSANFNGIHLLDGSLGDRELSTTKNGATSIRNISITGGGTEAITDITNDPLSGAVVQVDTDGTVSITLNGKQLNGIEWVYKDADGNETRFGAGENLEGKVAGADQNYKGGSVTFKAVIKQDEIDDGSAIAEDVAYFEGMEITVSVNGATDKDNGYDAGTITVDEIGGPKGLVLQIGDTADDYNQLNVKVSDMHAESLGVESVNISTITGAQDAIENIKNAINTVSSVRGLLGATQNRLDHTANNLSVMTENITDAESTIRDTDVADEMMAYTKNNILIQSAQAMLAQSNAVPQGVLQLLQ